MVVTGPTASGKTILSIRLAKYFQTEILSADARQFYRELRIGVGRPDPEQLREVPHHFIAHISIHESYSAGAYERDALALLDQLFAQHRVVILVGGSGLFIRAVTRGLDPLPSVSSVVTQQLQNTYQERGLAWLQQELRKLDPDYYKKVDLCNPRRLLRALAVCYASGRPYSSFLRGQPKPRPFSIMKFAIRLSADVLRKKINQRIDQMLEQGWLEEARALYPYRHLNALRTVGYPQLFQYLEGGCTWEKAVETIRIKTWQYARRQLTWLRAEPDVRYIGPDDDALIQTAVHHLTTGK